MSGGVAGPMVVRAHSRLSRVAGSRPTGPGRMVFSGGGTPTTAAVGIQPACSTGVKKLLWAILAATALVGVGWQSLRGSAQRLDAQRAKFVEDAGNLLLALQQYKEFTGHYPDGQNLDIARALSGQGPEKVVILAVRKNDRNAKGELVDPWGTPLAFYFSGNSVLIRSAGPNKVWEDSTSPGSDDLFRSN